MNSNEEKQYDFSVYSYNRLSIHKNHMGEVSYSNEKKINSYLCHSTPSEKGNYIYSVSICFLTLDLLLVRKSHILHFLGFKFK